MFEKNQDIVRLALDIPDIVCIISDKKGTGWGIRDLMSRRWTR